MIAPYHRDLLPGAIDNSNFGSELAEIHLTNDECRIDRVLFEKEQIIFDASTVIPSNLGSARIYGSCSADIRRALSSSVQTTIFMPDHATLIDANGSRNFLQESFWHTQLFFSDNFRNDRSTEWKWRSTYRGDVDLTYENEV